MIMDKALFGLVNAALWCAQALPCELGPSTPSASPLRYSCSVSLPNEISVLPDRRQTYFLLTSVAQYNLQIIRHFLFWEERRSQAGDRGIYILALTVAKKINAIYFYQKKNQISVSMLFQVDGVALSQSQHLGRIEGSDSLNIHRPHKDRSITRQKSDFRSSIFSFPIPHRMDSQQPNNGFGPLSKSRGSGAVFGAFLVVAVSGAVHIVNAIAFSSIKESKDEILFSELVRRVCLVNEERRNRHTRYEGSWKKLLNSTFTFRYGHSILVVGVVSFLTVSSFVLYYAL